jgi:uncharacterized membrane protein
MQQKPITGGELIIAVWFAISAILALLLPNVDNICSPYAVVRLGRWWSLLTWTFHISHWSQWLLFPYYIYLFQSEALLPHNDNEMDEQVHPSVLNKRIFSVGIMLMLVVFGCMRLLLGIAFFWWTGFAVPDYFFHEAFYESSTGRNQNWSLNF